MIKLPAGFKGKIITNASEFRAVVIAGSVDYKSKYNKTTQQLSPGSYVESSGKMSHEITNSSNTESTIYIRTNSNYQVD